jgi:Uncharacterized protein conserved in bacteria (DUF2252)
MAARKIVHLSVEQRRARGRVARDQTPPDSHTGWAPAADLNDTPVAGLRVQLCGDAHLSNFGAFASPERDLLFGLNDFARGLRSPLLYETIKAAEPVSAIFGYRNTDNQRRHFERLRRWPEGFVVIGDASCTFNPIYGQGMTVAAMTAVALHQILTKQRKRSGADLFGPARQLQRQVAKTNTGAWTMATTEDLRYPWTEGAQIDVPTRIMHSYADRVLECPGPAPGSTPHQPTHNQQARSGVHLTDRQRPDPLLPNTLRLRPPRTP